MQPTLFLMLGYPGAGKTTAAKTIHALTGAEHLWADKVRRHTYKQPTYSHAENLKLYEELNHQTEELLGQGKSVVYDTNFNYYKDREHLRRMALKNGANTILVWVKASKSLAKQRAVEDAHLHTHTRVLGHMPEDHFNRIANNFEPPKADEVYISIDGTKIDENYIKQALVEAGIL